MSISPEVKRERARKGLCVECARKPKDGRRRCETCLKKQAEYDKAYRERQKGATVEPQCKLLDRMRSEHEFDEDGLCDCGATRKTFEPRPELRAVLPAPGKQVAQAVARLAGAVPERVERARIAASAPVASRASAPPARATAARIEPSLAKSASPFAAAVDELKRRRAQLDEAIAALEAVETWWTA